MNAEYSSCEIYMCKEYCNMLIFVDWTFLMEIKESYVSTEHQSWMVYNYTLYNNRIFTDGV